MKMHASKSWPLLALVLGCATSASAFTLSGPDSNMQGWDTKELVFHLNPENCPGNVEAMLDDALDLWNGVATAGITLSRGETTESVEQVSAGQGQNVPAVFCLPTGVFPADPNSIPGFATGQHFTSGGHIDYGYLILNVDANGLANIERLSDQLVQSVIAHEVGHVLGLGHSESKNALMYYDASAKTNAALAQDDVDGLTYLYPRDELGKDKLMGCGTVDSRDGAAMALLFGLVLPLAFALRGRTQKPRLNRVGLFG